MPQPPGMRVLVLTVVHHPDDARIRHRQIAAMLEAGWSVTYAAPFAAYGLPRPVGAAGLTPLELPRATRLDRWPALSAARRVLREQGPGHDLVLLHDPELLLATVRLPAAMPPVVWDVHEDTAAALEVRDWVPGALRRPAKRAVRRVERWAEGRMPLLLADADYATRFRRDHPVIPNTTRVPERVGDAARPGPDGTQRLVYLGSLTIERGAAELVALGQRVAGDGIVVEIIGPAHGPAAEVVRRAAADGSVRWHGFVPSDQALPMLNGALAGLSLLHDAANFRPSMPTKVIEYLANGVPAISTPLPVPARLLHRCGAGAVVPFGDVDAVVATARDWASDLPRVRAMGAAGHQEARRRYDWDAVAPELLAVLADVVDTGGAPHRLRGSRT